MTPEEQLDNFINCFVSEYTLCGLLIEVHDSHVVVTCSDYTPYEQWEEPSRTSQSLPYEAMLSNAMIEGATKVISRPHLIDILSKIVEKATKDNNVDFIVNLVKSYLPIFHDKKVS